MKQGMGKSNTRVIQYSIYWSILWVLIVFVIWYMSSHNHIDVNYINRSRVGLLTLYVSNYYQKYSKLPERNHWKDQIIQEFDPQGALDIDSLFLDYWGNPIAYNNDESQDKIIIRIYSVGPNGIDELGEGDDIAGWRIEGVDAVIKKARCPQM